MDEIGRRLHWENVYGEKGERRVSWFQERADISLELIAAARVGCNGAIIDIGGGASRLVDELLRQGYQDVTVLDVSEAGLSIAKQRLAEQAPRVQWIVADVTQWEPLREYDLWHDRAAFHFLTGEADRSAYVARLLRALRPGGHAIIATFALDGPERCSGLPVARYDGQRLSEALGDRFALIATRRQQHMTPMGGAQQFQFSTFKRR